MTAIVFPANPVPGETFVADNNVTYKWQEDGTTWGVWRALGGGGIILPPEEPTATIKTPLVIYPPDGAGIGGDVSYTPMTSKINSFVNNPGGWQLGNDAPAHYWGGLCFGTPSGNNRFVACAASGDTRIMYSDNGGVTWRGTAYPQDPLNPGTTGNWAAAAYGENLNSGSPKYVLVGYNPYGGFLYSDNGITWTQGAATVGLKNWESVTSGDGRFVTVASNGNSRMAYSDNGVNWTLATARDTNTDKGDWVSVAYGMSNGNQAFCAVARDGDNRVALSTDGGIVWNTKLAAHMGISWNSVAYGNGVWVAVGDAGTSGESNGNKLVMYSTHGSTWSSDGVKGVPLTTWSAVTFADGRFVAVGQYTTESMYSEDGITWTTTPTPDADKYLKGWFRLAHGFTDTGSGRFVSTNSNSNGKVMWSETGTAGSTTLGFGDAKTHDKDTGEDMGVSISESFRSGQKVYAQHDPSITGTLTTDAVENTDGSGTMTLTDVTGAWANTYRVVSETQVTENKPGVDELEFVSSIPVEETGDITEWGKATWKVSKNADMSDAMTSVKDIEEGVEQTLDKDERDSITLEDGETYYVTVEYDSKTPVAKSDPSEINEFKTAGIGGAYGNFSTKLYPGTGSEQTIGTGIDNSVKSLVWLKDRSSANYHELYDTTRGPNKSIASNDSAKEANQPTGLSSFNPITIGNSASINTSGSNYVAWNFAAGEGFFDVVTYTGTGSPQVVPHSLGSTPGFTIIKTTSSVGSWYCLHKDLSKYLLLEENSATDSTGDKSNIATVDSDNITVTGGANVNSVENVAYLFADNPAGGIKCGKTTGTYPYEYIDVGFKPGWVMTKPTGEGNWFIVDNQRFKSVGENALLNADTEAEEQIAYDAEFSDQGFKAPWIGNGIEFIYIAIADTPSDRFYDENTASTVTNHTLTKRYGVDPLNTDLRHMGIFPLTEQPTYTVSHYERVGQQYKPIRDFTSELNALRTRVAQLESGEEYIAPTPTPTTDFIVTVQNVGGYNKYFIDGVQQSALSLNAGQTYVFDTSDESMSGHPFKLYTSATKASEYTTGVTYGENSVTLVAPNDTSVQIHYQCELHSLMGGILSID